MSAYVSHFLRHSRIEQIGHKIAHYLRRSTSFPPYEQGRWTSLSNGTFSRHTTPDADLLSALGYTSFADTYDMGDESEFSVLVTVETPHPPEDVFDAALDVASWGTWDHAVAAADVVHAIAPMRFSDGSKGALDVIRIHYPPGPYVCLRVHARCPDGSFFVGHVSDPEGVLAAYFGLRRRDVGAADAFDLLGLDPDRMWLILPTGFHITPMGGGGCRLTHVLHLNTRELCPPQLVQHFVRIKSLTLKKFIDEVESRKTARKEIKARLERRFLGGVGEVDSMYGVPQGKDVYRHYLGGGVVAASDDARAAAVGQEEGFHLNDL